MRIQVRNRKGNYNLCNPSEVGYSNEIKIVTENGEIIKRVSVVTDYEIWQRDNNPLFYADELREFLKTKWIYTGRVEVEEMIKFLEDNCEDLEIGFAEYEIINLENKKKEIDKRIEKMRKRLGVEIK